MPDIEGWPAQLNQAFMTVLLNASQAIEAQGEVSIETTHQGDSVVVRIHDNGRGMDETQRAALFDVGWSSAGTRTKLRLGLSAARAAVERHAGRIEVDSTEGQGTRFTLTFPAHGGDTSLREGPP